LNILAEASTKEISQVVEPKNFSESKKVVSPINAKTVLGESKKTKKLNPKKKK